MSNEETKQGIEPEPQAMVEWYENNSKPIFEEQLEKPAHQKYDGTYDEFFSMLSDAFINVNDDMVKETLFNLCDHYEAAVQRKQAKDFDGGEEDE